MDEYDYVIVGAGSAGCVLADRLSRDGRNTILILEAGGSDRRAWIKLPIGYGRIFFDVSVNWKYETEPDPACNGRKGYWPRGKVIGGSSSINALVYCRGLPEDYDDWKEAGAHGWGWDDVRPHFERIERKITPDGSPEGDGPMWVTDVSDRAHRIGRHFFNAARELGFTKTDDFNGPQPEGVGYYQITTRNGLRCSAADAFLRPALKRRNVTLISGVMVQRVSFDKRHATGVVFEQDGKFVSVRARKEVISSAGSVNSPKLLQLSGVGPGAVLQRHGLNVVHENENVGGNLQDHTAINYYYKATEPTLNDELRPWWGQAWAGMKYVLTRGGPLSLSVNQCGGFVRSSPDVERPDMQLYFTPISYTTAPNGTRPLVTMDPFPGFQICFQPSRPTSRGRIDIQSPDAGVAPKIFSNYLSTNKDLEDVVAGGRLIQSFVRTDGLRQLIAGPNGCDLASLSDNQIVEDYRERSGTVFHPVSTCMMGPDERYSVVGPDLKVHGVTGLRVIDASTFPNVTSGNTNAPTLMLAHKAADSILSE